MDKWEMCVGVWMCWRVTNHLSTMDEYGCGWVCQLTTVGNIWLVCLLGVLYFVKLVVK